MKKLLSKLVAVILAVAMLFSTIVVVNAESIDYNDEHQTQDTPTGFLYEDKFAEWIIFKKYDPNIHSGTYEKYFDYDELYTHYTDNNEVDWVLISAKVDMYEPWEKVWCKKIGNRVLRSWSTGLFILLFGLCIYDAQEDTFYDLYNVVADDYDGLTEVIEIFEFGNVMGDVDLDGEISILDATAIQMYLAHLIEYDPNYNAGEHIRALADVDGDSEMSVLDATQIQLQLAQLI